MYTATYITKEQIWDDETTIYYFDLDGQDYGVVEAGGDSSRIVDGHGWLINIHDEHNVHLPVLLVVTDEMRND